MKFINGSYKKKCSFNLCQKDFQGRLNKKFCSDKCKQAHNNAKVSKVNQALNGDGLKLKKATRILLNVFSPNKNGVFEISLAELSFLGFPFDVPVMKVKHDLFPTEMNQFGCFCFIKVDSNFKFLKID